MYISREDGVKNVHIHYGGEENLLHRKPLCNMREDETLRLWAAITLMFNPAVLMHQ